MTPTEKNKYRKSNQWKKIRSQLYEAHNYTCEICNQRKPAKLLNAHHLDDSTYGNESLSDLACLCKSCHLLLERRLLRIKTLDIDSFCKNLSRVYRSSKHS